jgi:hypothetical protein
VVLKPRAQENFPVKVNNHHQCGCMAITQDQIAQDQFAYQLNCWDAFVKLNLLLPLTIPMMQMPWGQSIMCYLF